MRNSLLLVYGAEIALILRSASTTIEGACKLRIRLLLSVAEVGTKSYSCCEINRGVVVFSIVTSGGVRRVVGGTMPF